MDSATVDSVYENLFSAQNFFAMHEQQQIEKQNLMMANSSLIDLDIFRYENGGGDASGSLLLGEDYCFKDDAANSSGSASIEDNSAIIEADGAGAIETTGSAASSAVTTTKAASLLDWQPQQQQQQEEEQNKDETLKLDAFDLQSSLTGNFGGAPRDCLWSSKFRPTRPPPTIQINQETFALRSDTVFVLGMRLNVTKNDIILFFGKMGHIKMDELTLKPKIFVYKNKLTGRSKGEATITYTSSIAAQAAIYYLDGAKFLGQVLSVVPAYLCTQPGKSVRFIYAQNPVIDQQRRQRQKKWKPAIDNWVCELCRNSNFVWRLSCNRCRVNKSESIAISNATTSFSANSGGGVNIWRPRKHDWTCGYCFNVNFWYRQKCNRCRAPKVDLNGGCSESDRDKWELVISQTSVV